MRAIRVVSVCASLCATGLLHLPQTAHAEVTIDWVTIGDPGNEPHPTTGRGSVAEEYLISTYEITNEQYVAEITCTIHHGWHGQALAQNWPDHPQKRASRGLGHVGAAIARKLTNRASYSCATL